MGCLGGRRFKTSAGVMTAVKALAVERGKIDTKV